MVAAHLSHKLFFLPVHRSLLADSWFSSDVSRPSWILLPMIEGEEEQCDDICCVCGVSI